MRRKNLILTFLACACVSIAQAQTINLFAAASLKESATEISKAFQKKHSNVIFSLNFGGSQQLVAQIRQGAPVDVLLSAGLEAIDPLKPAKDAVRIFTTNKLAIVVPVGSHKIDRFQDLNKPIRLIVADSHVPVGYYTNVMLAKALRDLGGSWIGKVRRNMVSQEQDVRAVLSKVELGEADAGIVYVTDFMTAKGKVRMIPVPDRYNVQARYPAVFLSTSSTADIAKEFIEFLFDKEAQTILARHGFGLPPGAGR